MPTLDTIPAQQAKGGSDLPKTISRLSTEMLALDPGPLAEIRRMEPGGTGPSAYWRLASRSGFLQGDADRWTHVVKIMAILTPKGERQPTDRLHDARRPLGAVMCDGGDPKWEPRRFDDADGVLPQIRLARFLALPPQLRPDALERMARMIASKRQRESGVNCVEIAALLLSGSSKKPLKAIARDYYIRLDSTARAAQNKEEGA